MKTKLFAILFVFSAAASAPVVVEAQSTTTPLVPARAAQATGPIKTDAAPAQHQGRAPVDAEGDRRVNLSGSAVGSSGAGPGPSMPMQAVPPMGDKPLPKPY